MKTGLVLEGGGVRGIYTAGVLDVFMEHGITFDGVIGVSAGAVHACSYLSGQKGRSLRYYKKYSRDPRFMSMQSFFKTGNIVGVDFCYHELPDKLDIYDNEAFLANGTPFFAGCTDLETGEAAYLRVNDMRKEIDKLRASASLPFLSKPVEVDGRKYLDGGCSDGIPIEAFRKMGYARNVIVLTRSAAYVKKQKYPLLSKLVYRKYPAFVRSLLGYHQHYNETVARIKALEQAGEVFVIRPARELGIKRLEKDSEKIQAVYERGRADAEACVERLLAWLLTSKEKV